MKGDNHVLALTTTTDEITGERKPLFAFPIQVCKATGSEQEIRFDIAAPSGAAREQIFRDSATGEIITEEDCRRGVRVGDAFHAIPDEAIAEVAEATKIKTLVAEGRVPLSDFYARYGTTVTGFYYLQSPTKGGSHKAYRLTYEALREVRKGKRVIAPATAIVTKRTAKSRQKVCAIYADEARGCLVMVEVAFAAQVRQPDEAVLAPMQTAVEDAQIEMARTVVANLPDGTEFLETAQDDAIALKRELQEKAVLGEEITVPTPVSDTVEAGDLTALLEASIKAAA